MLLALDTSTRTIGLALFDGQRVAYETVWTSQQYHTVELAPMVAQALDQVGLAMGDLRALGVARGPGSFTSLRVGLAFAKGLAVACRAALIGVPTLDPLAAAQPLVEAAPLAAVLQAGRGRLAVGWYHVVDGAWRATGELGVVTPADLARRVRKPTVICGELDEATRRLLGRKYKNALIASPARNLRRPSFLAEMAWDRWQAGQVDEPEQLAPQYLQQHDK